MPVPANDPGNTPPTSGEVSPQQEVEIETMENGHTDGATSPPLIQMNGMVINDGESSSKPNKMFIGGLSWQTTEEGMEKYFENFGEVSECNIMRDPVTKRSRGFGFITFKEPETVDKVLGAHEEDPLCIDEKAIDPKIAVPPKRLSNKVKRIFVGGLSSDSTEEDLREYFEQFGKVVESQLMYDRNTNRHRGFGFVTFESEEPAEKVCSIQYHDVKGKKVEVKVAQTKEALAMQGRGRMFTPRNYAAYGYPTAATYAPYYTTQYPVDLLMGGYTAGPIMLGGGGVKMRGKGRSYSHYPTPAYTYGPGYMDHRRMNALGGYYQPGYGGMVPPQMIRGHLPLDQVSPSSMDYLTDQFQGMAFNGGYPGPTYSNAPLSPQYTSMMDPSSGGYSSNGTHFSHSGMAGGSYSPPSHTLSPKGTATTSSINFSTQVPTYTGSQNSYAVAQPSY